MKEERRRVRLLPCGADGTVLSLSSGYLCDANASSLIPSSHVPINKIKIRFR